MSIFCWEISKACGVALLSEFMSFTVGKTKDKYNVWYTDSRGQKAQSNY